MPESVDVGILYYIKVFCTLIIPCLILRTLFVLQQIQTSRRQRCQHHQQNSKQQPEQQKHAKQYPIKTMIVLGSGGHTTEMLRMTQSLDPKYYHPIIYVKASTDTTSVMRLQSQSSSSNNNKNTKTETPPTPPPIVYDIPRSREVGQSYISSIFSTLYAGWYAFVLMARTRPQLILTNGPGTCVPLVLAALIFRILGFLSSTRTVFVESYCRVQTLSLTGKVLFYIVDLFVVHWEELHQQYPNTTVLVQTFQNYK